MNIIEKEALFKSHVKRWFMDIVQDVVSNNASIDSKSNDDAQIDAIESKEQAESQDAA